MPTIMHISDLHRSNDDPVSNAELVAAIERDIDRQSTEDPPIPPPQAIVVSGDLIRGAAIGESGSNSVIISQYQEVEAFLAELTGLLLDGDKSRTIICPGNHDVDWNVARAAMKEVSGNQLPSDIYGSLIAPNSPYRWDWNEQKLYMIDDRDVYEKRMENYWKFAEEFYRDTCIQFPEHTSKPLLVELFDRRILVAALNSCEANDCFRKSAEIDPEALAQMHLETMRNDWTHELKIAVWHHNTLGPPSADDYMRIEQVHALIEYGYRLGLHGHQHRSELVSHELRLPTYGNMAVLSTGSLAAGVGERPPGVNRQYSMIEIDDDLTQVRFHLREVETGLHFSARRLNAFGGRSYNDIDLGAAADKERLSGRLHRLNHNSRLNEAEAAQMMGDIARVIELLEPHVDDLNAYGRELLMSAEIESKNWEVLLKLLDPPRYRGEIALIAKSAVALGNFDLARSMVSDYAGVLQLPAPQRDELLNWIDGEEAIR